MKNSSPTTEIVEFPHLSFWFEVKDDRVRTQRKETVRELCFRSLVYSLSVACFDSKLLKVAKSYWMIAESHERRVKIEFYFPPKRWPHNHLRLQRCPPFEVHLKRKLNMMATQSLHKSWMSDSIEKLLHAIRDVFVPEACFVSIHLKIVYLNSWA